MTWKITFFVIHLNKTKNAYLISTIYYELKTTFRQPIRHSRAQLNTPWFVRMSHTDQFFSALHPFLHNFFSLEYFSKAKKNQQILCLSELLFHVCCKLSNWLFVTHRHLNCLTLTFQDVTDWHWQCQSVIYLLFCLLKSVVVFLYFFGH